MNKLHTLSVILLLCLWSSAQVGIGTDTPDPAAILDINSEISTGVYGGLKLPIVTLAQRAAIPAPIPDGLMIYVNDGNTRCVQLYDATQAMWMEWYSMNEVPVVSAVDYTGTLEVGEMLSSSYTYTDLELDVESGSIFQWYRADDATGLNAVAISGANMQTYTATSPDGGKFVAVSVTPGANTGASPGLEVLSPYKEIEFKQTVVEFAMASTNVDEEDLATITINLANPHPTIATSIDVNINSSSTIAGVVNVDYAIEDNNNVLITSNPFTITIPAGAASATFDFLDGGDDNDAVNNTLILDLQNPTGGTNATITGGQNSHTINIIDDDNPTAVAFTTLTSSVDEPATAGTYDAVIAVSIANPSTTATTTVQVTQGINNTAETGDYTIMYDGNSVTLPFTVTFIATQTTNESFTVTAVDDADTNNESLELVLTTVTGGIPNAIIGVDDTHTLSIDDDEVPSGGVFISEIADPNNNDDGRYMEFYNSSSAAIDVSDWVIIRYTNAGTSSTHSHTFPSGTIIPSNTAIVGVKNTTNFTNEYSLTADLNDSDETYNSNGDENYILVDNNGIVIDAFGVVGTDGTGTCHEFENGRALRNASVTIGNPIFDESEWTIWADSTVSGCTSHTNDPRNAPTDFTPKSHPN